MKFFINTENTTPSVTFVNRKPAELSESELNELGELYYAFELKMAEFEKEQGRTRLLNSKEDIITSFKEIKSDENAREHFVLMMDQNTIIGFACWVKSSWFENMCIIQNIFLNEEYRGKSLGKKLVEFAVSSIREGYSSSMISIGVITANTKAKSLYNYLGFTQLVHESYLMK